MLLRQKTLFWLVVLMVSGTTALVPGITQARQITLKELGPIPPLARPHEILVSLNGCREVLFRNNNGNFDLMYGEWPDNVVARHGVGTPVEPVADYYESTIIEATVLACPPNIDEVIGEGIVSDPANPQSVVTPVAPEEETDPAKKFVIWIMNGALTIVATLANWLLWIGGKLLGYLLGVGQFISHPFVRVGWPFVQGIANLGFMIALVFIALTTTLNLSIGGGMYKTLPRLFLAAILINFSLVICGLLIDMSRLAMAATLSLIDQGTVQDLGGKLVTGSGIITGVFSENSLISDNFLGRTAAFDKTNSWTIPGQILRATILMWGLVIGIWYAVAILFVRYIALLLLLITSPIAFLAFAFPGMESKGKQWWGQFIQWVLYGPIVVFLLVLASSIGGIQFFNLDQRDDSLFQGIISIVFTIAILMTSAKMGKSIGAAGASAALSFADKARGKARNYAYRGGALVGKAAGGSAKLIDRQVGDRTGYGVQRGISSVRDYLGQRREGRQREVARREAQRREGSIGTAMGRQQYQDAGLSPQALAQAQARRTAANTIRSNPRADAYSPHLSARNLRVPEAGREMNASQINSIIQRAALHGDNDDQLGAITNNVEIVNNMTPAHINDTTDELERRFNDPRATDTQRQGATRMLNELQRTMREAERRQRDATRPPTR